MNTFSSRCVLALVMLCGASCGRDQRARPGLDDGGLDDGEPPEFTPPLPEPGDGDGDGDDAPPVAGSGGESGSNTDPGGQGGMGGSPEEPPVTFVHPEGVYKFHIDCAAEISGDGSSWDAPMNHPAQALRFAESGDSLLLKRGQCVPQFEGQVIFDVPAGMALSIGGGYTGDERDQIWDDDDFTVISADSQQNDLGSPWDFQSEVRESRTDNSEGIVNLAPGAEVFMGNLRLYSAASYDANSYDFSRPCGAIVVGAGATLHLVRSELAFHASGFAAALFADRGARVYVERTKVWDNFAANYGSIVRAEGAELSWEAGLGFYDNRMEDGSALEVRHSLISLFDLTFFGNETTGYGAAIHASGGLGLLSIDSVEFVDNFADSGGAVAVRGARAQVTNSLFRGNEAAGYGSAVSVSDLAEVTLENSSFVDNSATASGTIFVEDSQAEFFGLRLLWNEGFLSSGIAAENSEVKVAQTILGSNHTASYEDEAAGTIVSVGGELHLTDSLIVGTNSGVSPTIQIHGKAHLERVGLIDNSGAEALRFTDGDGALTDSFLQGQRSSGAATVTLNHATVDIIGVSLMDNADASGEGISEFSVGEASQLTLSNSALWSSSHDGEQLAQVTPDSTFSFVGSCAGAPLDGVAPAALLSASPFVAFAHVGPLLKDDAPCVDVGESVLLPLYERSPTLRTAVASLTPDSDGKLDAGLHTESDFPAAASIEFRPRLGTWNAGPYPNHCWLYVQGDYWMPRMAGTQSQVSPIQAPYEVGAEAYLTCVDLSGRRLPIALRTFVLPEE